MEPQKANPAEATEQDGNIRDKQEDDLLKSNTDKEIEETENRGYLHVIQAIDAKLAGAIAVLSVVYGFN